MAGGSKSGVRDEKKKTTAAALPTKKKSTAAAASKKKEEVVPIAIAPPVADSVAARKEGLEQQQEKPPPSAPASTPENLGMMLMEAAEKCDLERVKALLGRGADAAFVHDPPGIWGSCDTKSVLHAALQGRPPRPRRKTEETKKKKKPGEEEEDEEDHSKKYRDWVALVRLLVENKADVNGKRKNYDWRGCGSQQSAFEIALPAAMEDEELLELFLRHGADPNTKSVRHVHSMRTDGMSVSFVLHRAVKLRNLEIVRCFLDAKAEVDAVAKDEYHNERGYNQHMEETALHQACAAGDLAMVALLLARGADVNKTRIDLIQKSSGQESATDDPREEGFVSSVVCVPVRETALHIALRNKHADLVVMLVCAGADVSTPREEGRKKTSAESLCAGEDEEKLRQALKAEWTPETHKLFPADVRRSVETALVIAKRQEWPLPETLLFHVCAMASKPSTSAEEPASSAELPKAAAAAPEP